MAAAPQDEASRVKLEAWLVTDVGVVREHNEDSAFMEPTNGFFIVADGMGGHAAGEVASALRTILVNAIGVSADVGVEMAHVTLKRGDRLLLCSDGLHDYFPVEEEIAQKLSTDAPGDALKDMVELAKTRGGHDNITGVAVLVS